jgi:hypothetical protein
VQIMCQDAGIRMQVSEVSALKNRSIGLNPPSEAGAGGAIQSAESA